MKKNSAKIPWMSSVIILVYGWLYEWQRRAIEMGLVDYLVKDYAFSWQSFSANPLAEIPHLVSYTFIHSDGVHLFSNAVFFFLFAFFVERFIGPIEFLLLYLTGGAVAAIIQGLFNPFITGMIGSSGAIAAVGGAFFVLAPSYMTFKKHVFFSSLLVAWYGLEWLQQLKLPSSIPLVSNTIAHGAHVGGFCWGGAWGACHLLLKMNSRSQCTRESKASSAV